MKLEKLSDNKIKVTFSLQELEKQNIDYHSFMSNSVQTKFMFTNLLCKAKEELDFNTDNADVSVETFELADGNFILTITKFSKKKKVVMKRKVNKLHNNSCIYKFASLDNFCDFCAFLKDNPNTILEKLQNKNSLFVINNEYFLIINNLLLDYKEIAYLSSSITEFAEFINSSSVLITKFKENSKCIMKDNAIELCLNFFV